MERNGEVVCAQRALGDQRSRSNEEGEKCKKDDHKHFVSLSSVTFIKRMSSSVREAIEKLF